MREVGFHRESKRTCSRVRPEPGVHPVQLSFAGRLREIPDKALGKPVEVGIDPGGQRPGDFGPVGVDEYYVDVGTVVQLIPSEFPQSYDAECLRGMSLARFPHLADGDPESCIHNRTCEHRELGRGRGEIGIPQYVLRADPEKLPAVEALEGIKALFRSLERVQNTFDFGAQVGRGDRGREGVGGGEPPEQAGLTYQHIGKIL